MTDPSRTIAIPCHGSVPISCIPNTSASAPADAPAVMLPVGPSAPAGDVPSNPVRQRAHLGQNPVERAPVRLSDAISMSVPTSRIVWTRASPLQRRSPRTSWHGMEVVLARDAQAGDDGRPGARERDERAAPTRASKRPGHTARGPADLPTRSPPRAPPRARREPPRSGRRSRPPPVCSRSPRYLVDSPHRSRQPWSATAACAGGTRRTPARCCPLARS